jgi:hypothetical protein
MHVAFRKAMQQLDRSLADTVRFEARAINRESTNFCKRVATVTRRRPSMTDRRAGFTGDHARDARFGYTVSIGSFWYVPTL